jgi:tripartite-type tricarboxylate transporter receptor subunit TctC
MLRRSLIALPLAAIAVPALAFPDRAVRLVVPFPAGGGADIVGRTFAELLAARLSQPVVVENRAGAGAIPGTEAVARAAPDGHTLLLGSTGPLAINPALQPNLPYAPARDFVAVGVLAFGPAVLVVNPAALDVADLPALLARARAEPGRIEYASPGVGNIGHLMGEMLKRQAGIDLLHVPYRGAAPALNDVLGGRVPLLFDLVPSAVPHLRAGRLRALGVTGPARSALLPEVPTIAEQGLPGYAMTSWFLVVVPAATPAPALGALRAAFRAMLADPAARARLSALGLDPATGDEDPVAFLAAELERWGEAVRISGARVE